MTTSFLTRVVVLLLVTLATRVALAETDAGVVDASVEAGAPDGVAQQYATLAEGVRALVSDEASHSTDVVTLLGLDPNDEESLALERLRLETVVRAFAPDAGRKKPARVVDAGQSVSSLRLEARLELDRARLSFFQLSSARRAELVEHLRARVAAEAPPEAETRAQQAEAERQQALEAAQRARSEAERVVQEEHARLLAIEADQTAFEHKLVAGRARVDAGRETTLVWQRRARAARSEEAAPEVVDAVYDSLRAALRAARDELDEALRDATHADSQVPVAGADPLETLQLNIDLRAVHAERERVQASAERLAAEEKTFHDERAAQLSDEIDDLNAERLALLPYLSSAKRSAIIGFTTAGVDQATAEIRQLTLIARYHRLILSSWLAAARQGHGPAGDSARAAVIVLLEWLAVLAAFLWVRRRLPVGLHLIWKRARTEDRRLRLSQPSLPTRVAGFAVETHRPILWLVLAIGLFSLLPSTARNLLEVRLLSITAEWIVGGAIVIVVVNAIAGVAPSEAVTRRAPALRLRSLRLVGGVIVAFGLALALTSRLVGPGTIYRWVFSTCWLASLPVFLVLVRWWREYVFERAERSRRKSAIERWLLAHRRGWKSLVAATIGAVYLFVRGSWRVGRGWIGSFTLTRSVLAYLFRRELGKLEAARAEIVSEDIPASVFALLDPAQTASKHIATDADEALERLRHRIRDKRGGVVALVGPLGIGKTTALATLCAGLEGAVLLDVPVNPDEGFAATAASAADSASVVLVDNAHLLVRPMMGGLAPFDALLAAAIDRSSTTTWVLAFDEVLWLFLQRARGSRPLFDDVIRLYPWREEQLVLLIEDRTAAAGIAPSFENLLDHLPSNGESTVREEALEERAASYYRLLWDYAGGNPGIALHMWRRALGVDASGVPHVRFFQAPNAAELEPLPDQTIFVLRAVMQLGAAKPDEIAAATMLHNADIVDALRYALARGYVQLEHARYRVTWTWHRALSVFLQRRHLLVRS